MSHDPEAVEAIDQWLAMPQRPDRDTATDLLDYLAATGYTVTKGRYEPVRLPDAGDVDGDVLGYFHAATEDFDLFRCSDPPADGWEPLYRKIDGSTDGDDRD